MLTKERGSIDHILLNNQVMNRQNGFFQLEKDKEAITIFQQEVQEKLIQFDSIKERYSYMIKNDYYYNVFDEYALEDIEDIHAIVKSYDFHFQSYMAISKFYNDYALKTNDKKHYLETYEDRIVIVSLYLAEGNVKKAKRHAIAMIEQRYQPATPTMLNAGRSRRGEMVSCFLLSCDDTLNSINYILSTSMQLSKIGGGVAIDLSKVRGRGEAIKGVMGAAKGVIPVMKLLDDAFGYADQMGQRKGAGAVYYNIFGWDLIEVLDSKKINVDERSRLKTLSIGLIAPEKFFEIAENNEPFYVFGPHSVHKEYGQHLADMDMNVMYDKLVANDRVLKKQIEVNGRILDGKDILNRIAITLLESGYPYMMFKDNANKFHPLRGLGEVKMSNLCSEIMQVQQTSVITDYGQEDIIKWDVNCNLGSVNITNVMETKKFQDTMHVGIESLTAVSDKTNIENAPSAKKANDELHAVGLGAMNLNGYLAKNKIPYESFEARDFVRTFFMMMNFYTLEKSMLIAKEKKKTFVGFEKSDYATGVYFDKYLQTDFSPHTEKVKSLFEGIHIPTPDDWANLKKDVMQYGIYNAYRMAIAPTQSIGYVQNSTQSIMPVVDQIEERSYENSKTYFPMPYLSPENFWYYKSAYNMDQYKLIDLVALAQEHVDQGISCTLFVNSDISTRELAKYYLYAQKKGLKSVYYIRQKRKNIEECLSCSV